MYLPEERRDQLVKLISSILDDAPFHAALREELATFLRGAADMMHHEEFRPPPRAEVAMCCGCRCESCDHQGGNNNHTDYCIEAFCNEMD